MCVLLVDDSPNVLATVQELLRANGYPEIRTASSAAEALERLAAETDANGQPRIEVILVSLSGSGASGLAACRGIKDTKEFADIPILAVIDRADDDVAHRAFDCGALDFLTRPVQKTELLARLHSALKLKTELDRCKKQKRQLEETTDQMRRLNKELESLAIRDELTGVGNRRFFNLLLEQEWARATRDVLPLSLILLDLDFFKAYNDHYGHLRGDECLRCVANCLDALLQRSGDHVARYGGEEFAVLLPHTAPRGAVKVAERLRTEVEKLSLEHCAVEGRPVVTVSLGVATLVPERPSRAESLIAAADRALYEAKHEGRNRVRVYEGDSGRETIAAG